MPGGHRRDRRRREWRLRSLGSSVPSLRWALCAFLADAGLPADELQDLILAACEAATNAVEHAQHPTEPFVDMSVEIEGGVVPSSCRTTGSGGSRS